MTTSTTTNPQTTNQQSTSPQLEIIDSSSSPPRRLVHHWATCWLGKVSSEKDGWLAWEKQAGEFEVSVQEYGQPHWIEDLFSEMIDTGREILDDAPDMYTAVRLRVRLFSHRPNGSNAKFTLEHIEYRQ